MNIAVIPARGGSKRIPRKNTKDFCGKPMIAWSIEAAKATALFAHVIVSTDDAEIADVSRTCGAEVPFMRPGALADDHATIPDVMEHAVQWGVDQQWPMSAVCCISATAPLLRCDDVRRGFQEMSSGGWAYAFAVTDFAAPIFRSFRQHPDGGLDMFFPEYFTTRSQDLPVAFHDAGQFYWGRPDAWLSRTPIFGRQSYPVVIPRSRVQDIDTPDDWLVAEALYRAISANPVRK